MCTLTGNLPGQPEPESTTKQGSPRCAFPEDALKSGLESTDAEGAASAIPRRLDLPPRWKIYGAEARRGFDVRWTRRQDIQQHKSHPTWPHLPEQPDLEDRARGPAVRRTTAEDCSPTRRHDLDWSTVRGGLRHRPGHVQRCQLVSKGARPVCRKTTRSRAYRVELDTGDTVDAKGAIPRSVITPLMTCVITWSRGQNLRPLGKIGGLSRTTSELGSPWRTSGCRGCSPSDGSNSIGSSWNDCSSFLMTFR